LLVILFTPLLLFLLFSTTGRFLGQQGVSFLSVFFMFFTTIFSFFAFYWVGLCGEVTYITLGT
jgi:hypothetical protein